MVVCLIIGFVQVSTVANQTVTNPVFLSHHGQIRVEQILENRAGVINFAAIPMTAVSTKSKRNANRPVSAQTCRMHTESDNALLVIVPEVCRCFHQCRTRTIETLLVVVITFMSLPYQGKQSHHADFFFKFHIVSIAASQYPTPTCPLSHLPSRAIAF